MALSTGAVEYTVFISADGLVSPNECSGYDTKQSAGEAPVMLEFRECNVPHFAINPNSDW